MKVAGLLSIFASAALAASTPAQALKRVWVSGQGADTASCGATASPCRTFQYAHNLVEAGGEIVVRDSGDFGRVAITKSVNIINDGAGTATVDATAAGQNAVTITANANAIVHLRGMAIEGFGAAANGIVVNSAGTLDIEKCVIRGFSLNGIFSVNTTQLTL